MLFPIIYVGLFIAVLVMTQLPKWHARWTKQDSKGIDEFNNRAWPIAVYGTDQEFQAELKRWPKKDRLSLIKTRWRREQISAMFRDRNEQEYSSAKVSTVARASTMIIQRIAEVMETIETLDEASRVKLGESLRANMQFYFPCGPAVSDDHTIERLQRASCIIDLEEKMAELHAAIIEKEQRLRSEGNFEEADQLYSLRVGS